MAVQIYTTDTVKAAVLQSLVYCCQLLAKFAVRVALDKQLKGLKVKIPVHLDVGDLDFELVELLECPFVRIMRENIEHINDVQERFILINALSIDAVEEHDDGLELAVNLAEYFLVSPLQNLIDDIFTDVDALYLNLIYLMHLLAYLLFYEQMDMDSDEFEGYWYFTVDENVFHFKDSEEKNISLIFTLINQMYAGKDVLATLWHKEK